LKEENNLVFVFFDNNIHSSSKVGIPKNIILDLNKNGNMNDYIVYECKDPNKYMRPDNINTKIPYFDIKKLCGYGDLIPFENVEYIFTSLNKNENNIFIFKKSKIQCVTTVSDNVLHHRTGTVSARHCQEGQSAIIYGLYTPMDSKEIDVDRKGGSYRYDINNKSNKRRQQLISKKTRKYRQ
jgi:hypothetical protein